MRLFSIFHFPFVIFHLDANVECAERQEMTNEKCQM